MRFDERARGFRNALATAAIVKAVCTEKVQLLRHCVYATGALRGCWLARVAITLLQPDG